MQTIFSCGLATGRHAIGSSKPLGTPNDHDTHESDTINVDTYVPREAKANDHAPKLPKRGEKKRKRGALVDEEVLVFTSMTEAVREVASAIRDSVPVDVHPDLYEAMMSAKRTFSNTAKIVALYHLLENKAQGFGFILMTEDHRLL